ncbi:MAG: ABC transporter substrate-binding protein [Evtepia gabavorous]
MAEKAGFTVQAGRSQHLYELMINNESIASADLRHAIEKALTSSCCASRTAGPWGRSPTPASCRHPHSGPSDLTTHDPDQAKQLLDKAGYQGRPHPGLHQCSASLAALIQQNPAAVGIQVEIETVDSATMFAGMNDGHL